MKLKLAKMIKNFVQILELLGDRLEVCVSVATRNNVSITLVRRGNKTDHRQEIFEDSSTTASKIRVRSISPILYDILTPNSILDICSGRGFMSL